MKIRSVAIFICITGLLTAGLAVFAQPLGLDHNPEWGKGRMALLGVGLCMLVAGIFLSLSQRYPVLDWLHKSPDIAFAAKLWRKYLFLLPIAALVLIVYVWFVSAGLWTTWPARTEYSYYSLLARAFRKGELHLPVRPSEKLLALPNPYDPSQRQGTGEPLDFTLYQGKFYLYWGPVPALLLVALSSVISRDLPDLYLVFGFSCGLFLTQTILLAAIWDRYFEALPRWILGMAVLLVGLAAPFTWMLSTARIYEVAIVGGQFFLMAGFFAVLSALDNLSSSNARLALAGSLWALAVGTRLTLIVPIGFMMLMVAYKLWKRDSVPFGNTVQKLVYLGLPVLLGLIGLAWYNWARFGSFSETGFSYALGGTYIRNHLDEVMSHRYIIQNLFNYFLVPFQLESEFPFIYSNPGSIKALFSFYKLPGFYNTNPLTGLVYVVPFVFFAMIAVAGLVSKRTSMFAQSVTEDNSSLRWIIVTLAASSFLALVFLLVFFWAAMRYVADFLPMLLVLSIIGFCQGYLYSKQHNREKYMAAAGISLAGISVVMSTILGISGDIVVFQEANPALLEWFGTLFR